MALPAEFATVTLAGKYVDMTGAPVTGSVTFTAPSILTAPTSDTMIVPKTFTVGLDAAGAFITVLPATNDPDISPTFTYTVKEAFVGVGLTSGRSYDIALPFNSAGTLQLADLAPVAPTVSGTAYVTLPLADLRYAPIGAGGGTGPQGPAGPAGQTGLDGVDGAAGATGTGQPVVFWTVATQSWPTRTVGATPVIFKSLTDSAATPPADAVLGDEWVRKL